MSYYHSASGTWRSGYPPTEQAFRDTMARVGGKRVDLSEGAQPPQHRAAELDLSDEAVRSRSDALLAELSEHGLDSGVVAASPSDEALGLEDADAQRAAVSSADALLAEMRAAGLFGGDAA